jgi:hypothetical protein
MNGTLRDYNNRSKLQITTYIINYLSLYSEAITNRRAWLHRAIEPAYFRIRSDGAYTVTVDWNDFDPANALQQTRPHICQTYHHQ